MPGVSTTLSLSLAPSLLALQASLVPVVATAGDGVSTWQTAAFGYDQQASNHRPTVSTSGNSVPTPGQPTERYTDLSEPTSSPRGRRQLCRASPLAFSWPWVAGSA